MAFPTETVYGLGADASNPEAIRKIFAIKGRPASHPLIVHIGDPGQMEQWAREVSPLASRLADRFWPGPLTLILRRGNAPPEVTGGQDSVGLRMPDHPVALALLHCFGGGIAAPSANRFGRVSPTSPDHVRDELGDAIDLILPGGNCRIGLESTILSLIDDQPILLRPGAISADELTEVIGMPLLAGFSGNQEIRAPGTLESHYAPETRLLTCPTAELETLLCQTERHRRKALMHLSGLPAAVRALPELNTCQMPRDASDYGQKLYATLRRLDRDGYDLIVIESPPASEDWYAVNDRISRASHKAHQ